MRSAKHIHGTDQLMKGFVVLFVIGSVLISGCASLGSNGSPSLARPPANVADSQPSVPSVAAEFNRKLEVLANRDSVEPPDYAIGAQDLLDVSLFNIDATDGL